MTPFGYAFFLLVEYICVLPHLMGLVFFHSCHLWEKITWIIHYGFFLSQLAIFMIETWIHNA